MAGDVKLGLVFFYFKVVIKRPIQFLNGYCQWPLEEKKQILNVIAEVEKYFNSFNLISTTSESILIFNI